MEFDRSKKDRSYQYGRLLAILEKIENDTYDNDNERTTNALRMQSIFVKRPAYASKILIEKLKNSYYSKLHTGSRIRYEKMIGEIYEIINEFGEKEYNKPLSEMYLIGYYLQKNELYKKKESIVSTENEEREE